MSAQRGKTNIELEMDMNQQLNAAAQELEVQQARMNAQQARMSAQPARMGTQHPSLSAQYPSTSNLHSGINTQRSSISTQHPSISTQHPSMSTQHPNLNISSLNTPQATMSAQHASMRAQQASMNTQLPSVSGQQTNVSTQLSSTSAHQPNMSAHLPSLGSQRMNLSSQQINMINQMNLHGQPMTLMNAQPIAMNLNNPSMNLHGQQIAMGINSQLMNMNLHTQPMPINAQHMINMHAPQLNIHGPPVNLINQPINAQNLNMHHQQMGMTAQQYNIQQMRLQQQFSAQQMYLNPQQINANLPQINMNTQPAASSSQQAGTEEVPNIQPPPEPIDRSKICQWLLDLNDPTKRENALIELCKRRENVPDLGVLIWHGFGTASVLLQEIMSIYSAINPAVLTASQSNRVCNALALLQCVAANAETRPLFIAAQFPMFLYPFLHTISKNRPFEYLRLTCLGVIGALVKNDEPEIIQYLLDTEIIPLCLRIMECGSELSKIVATFILQKILANERGLNYVCETYERFSHIAMILGKLVLTLAAYPSARLLKHIVKCYLRLSEHPRAKEALRQCIPDQLADATFNDCLQDEPLTRSWIAELLANLEIPKIYYDPRQPSKSSSSTTPH